MENKIQELTDKIYREGVEKGNEEAQRLIDIYTLISCRKVNGYAPEYVIILKNTTLYSNTGGFL